MRALAPAAVPTRSQIDGRQKEFDDYITEHLDPFYDETQFHLPPDKLLHYLTKKRKLMKKLIDQDYKLHLLLLGDGRGTGQSFKSVILEARILNEGRCIFRADRACLFSLTLGEEDRKHMPRRLKYQLDKLEELQRKGLRIEHDGKTYDLKMHLHLVSDAKFLQLTHGGARFCDEQPNCLKCFSKPEDGDDPTVR
mgnify:CR=1 FL=1